MQTPELPEQRALRADFLKSMGIVKDFWAEPTYAELLLAMQKRVHDYVVADQGTPRKRSTSWSRTGPKVFKDDGKTN